MPPLPARFTGIILAFAPHSPAVLALDDAIGGRRIKAHSIRHHRYAHPGLPRRDPTRGLSRFVCWFVRRWNVEVTAQETSANLGVEVQRQWWREVVAGPTPCLPALFSSDRVRSSA